MLALAAHQAIVQTNSLDKKQATFKTYMLHATQFTIQNLTIRFVPPKNQSIADDIENKVDLNQTHITAMKAVKGRHGNLQPVHNPAWTLPWGRDHVKP